jgi:hypothetical protein
VKHITWMYPSCYSLAYYLVVEHEWRETVDISCSILFLFIVSLACRVCHVQRTHHISVFTSQDSDSSSSSGSDTDAKALPQNSGLKENVLPVDNSDQEKGLLNTLNLPEQSTDPISVTADGEGKHEFS